MHLIYTPNLHTIWSVLFGWALVRAGHKPEERSFANSGKYSRRSTHHFLVSQFQNVRTKSLLFKLFSCFLGRRRDHSLVSYGNQHMYLDSGLPRKLAGVHSSAFNWRHDLKLPLLHFKSGCRGSCHCCCGSTAFNRLDYRSHKVPLSPRSFSRLSCSW